MTTFVDTGVVIYLLDPDSEQHSWSQDQINRARANGPVIIPDIAYTELSVGMVSKEATDEAIAQLALERLACSDAALYRAGQAFKKYRNENRGPKANVLPDFLIGAQAETESFPLLTSETGRYPGYFPAMKIICPE